MSNDPWVHRSDNMKCKTCMWFVPKVAATHPLHDNKHNDTNTYDIGRCRRHAPSMGGYPVVMVNDWCGDHRLDGTSFVRANVEFSGGGAPLHGAASAGTKG